MAVLNLNSFTAIQSNLFVKITLTASTLLFSDRIQSTTIAGDTYVGLGNLLAISGSNSELRSSSQELSISISGIPNSSITDILASGIKGTPVIIRRGLFNATTNAFLSGVAGNPIIRFTGFVNNLGFDEEYDLDTRTSSNTMILTCASNVDILNNKVQGRKTNSESQQKYFPNDLSMERVTALESSFFDFGANK